MHPQSSDSKNLGNNGIISAEPQPASPMVATYAHQRPHDNNTSLYESIMTSIGSCLGFFGTIPCCCCFPNPYRSVEQGNVGLITRFGRYLRTTDPGLTWVNPVTEGLKTADIKVQTICIADISIMTKDNVNITIDSVIYWHIVDPFQAIFGVANVRAALIERTQTTVRAVLGQRSLQDCIENRDEIALDIEKIISDPAESWGVKVESVLIKDLAFSRELQESLSSAAQAKRIGESRVIAAQAEVDSAKLMREAADILNSPAAIQIRYLDTMKQMSHTSGSKVIFMPYNAGRIDYGQADSSPLEGIMEPALIESITK